MLGWRDDLVELIIKEKTFQDGQDEAHRGEVQTTNQVQALK